MGSTTPSRTGLRNLLECQAELIRAAALAAQEKGAKIDPPLLVQATDLCGYLLASKQENDVRIGTELASSLQLIDHLDTIINIAKDSAMPTANRLACITSLGNMPNAKATNGLLDAAKNSNNSAEVRDDVGFICTCTIAGDHSNDSYFAISFGFY